MEFTCHTCGNLFYHQHNNRNSNKYCSKQCYYLKPKIIHKRNCEYCGKLFTQEREKVKCCSHVCAGLNRFPDVITRFWSYVTKPLSDNACWVWTGKTEDGYGNFYVRVDKKCKKHTKAHRFSWELHNGPIPDGLLVLHKCDNRPCVNPAHLFLGTILDNMRDRNEKGRQTRGETHPRARLTEEKVREIRRRFLNGEPGTKIARDVGMSDTLVYAIKLRQVWKHVP